MPVQEHAKYKMTQTTAQKHSCRSANQRIELYTNGSRICLVFDRQRRTEQIQWGGVKPTDDGYECMMIFQPPALEVNVTASRREPGGGPPGRLHVAEAELSVDMKLIGQS